MPYSVYARNRKSGQEYALPERYFGHLPTWKDAEIALDWYLQTSSASARHLVEVYIHNHDYDHVESLVPARQSERELVTA